MCCITTTGRKSLSFFIYILQFIIFWISLIAVDRALCDQASESYLPPTVVIAILARNKAHTLPHYLGYLEKLDYDKSRISLWIRSDHNLDNTADVIKTWLSVHGGKYHSVDVLIDDVSYSFADETGPFDWSPLHFNRIISLKEESLKEARKMWADYLWIVDCDVFLVNNSSLKSILMEKKTIIAPMVESLGAYSNYWCGMTEQGYYKRTEDYLPILEREKVGCFKVPMVHSAVLIDLRESSAVGLTFSPSSIPGYAGPVDDIIAFSHSAKSLDISMNILNTKNFGYMLAPLDKTFSLQDDRYQLTNLKVEMIVEESAMYTSESLKHFVPAIESDLLGLDEVYLINLKRRPERLQKMRASLYELGIKANTIDAVDGKALSNTDIEKLGIKMLPEYSDPYHKRTLTKGEIGCFLSHFKIWQNMIARQQRTAIVFEDDLRFEPFFKKKVRNLIKEAQSIGLLWDLIYLGRKRLSEETEPYVRGSSNFVHVNYSYWTLCYLITLEGAKKLVAANPLEKLIPVDEYLPIMFDRHPENVWKGYFPKRNLRAFSTHPLLVYPTHYVGEKKYISDTEDSEVAATMKDEL